MEKLTLNNIIKAVDGHCSSQNLDITEINNVCIDTRKVEAGCLFIAIKGENFDGHDFIDKAYELGCVACISSKPIPNHENVIVVEDTKKALLNLARYYRSLFNVFCVGVTGSVGKTSTKEMIYTILNENGKTIKTLGNFNNEIGMPLTMFNLDSSFKNAVFEMGMSDFGEISALTHVCVPQVGVITNIGVSHIENLGSRENILKAKLEITESMSNDSPLVLCADDDLLKTVIGSIERPIVYYGIDETAISDVYATDIYVKDNMTYFTINFYGHKIDAYIPVIGKHNVYNALAGFCVGILYNLDPQDIVNSMRLYKNADMRQNISVVENRTVIADCYNAAPNSMRAALDVLTTIECKEDAKRVCVLGDMLELGSISEEEHIELGKDVARLNIDTLICYGAKAQDIKRGAKLVGMKNVHHFEEKEQCINFIANNVKENDVILYKASRGIKLEEILKSVNEVWQNG